MSIPEISKDVVCLVVFGVQVHMSRDGYKFKSLYCPGGSSLRFFLCLACTLSLQVEVQHSLYRAHVGEWPLISRGVGVVFTSKLVHQVAVPSSL